MDQKKQEDINETLVNEGSQYPKLDWGPNIPQRTIQKAKVVGK